MPIFSGASGSGGSATAFANGIISATPPAAPVTGSLWVYPADDTNGVYWQFIYDSAETTYKWRFIGGPPVTITGGPNAVINTLTQVGATGHFYSAGITVARAGDYDIYGYIDFGYPSGATANQPIDIDIFVGSALPGGGRHNSSPWWTTSVGVNTGTALNGSVTSVSASTVIGVCANSGDNTHVTLLTYGTAVLPRRVI